jgi:hypothetical protein
LRYSSVRFLKFSLLSNDSDRRCAARFVGFAACKTLVAVALAGLLAACAVGTGEPKPDSAPDPTMGTAASDEGRVPLDVNIVEFHSDKLSPGQPIRIENHWGNIEVRSKSTPGSFDVTAAVQRIGHDAPAPPRFRQRIVDGVAELVVEFPGARIEPSRSGRVDLAVFVPAGSPLTLDARDGLVKAKKVANPLTVRTTSGPVQVINDGSIDVRSESGRVQIRPMYAHWDHVDARSEHGTVVAFLPTSSNFTVTAEGTDEVFSAYPLSATNRGLQGRNGTSGGPANRVELHSAHAIEIHEAYLAERSIADRPMSPNDADAPASAPSPSSVPESSEGVSP